MDGRHDRSSDREALRRERSEPTDPNVLEQLSSAIPRPLETPDQNLLRIRLEELGPSWSSSHHEFWEGLPIHMGRSPKLMFEILEVLLDRIKEVQDPTINNLDALITPLIYCAHVMNSQEIADQVCGYIDEGKREEPSIIGYRYAQLVVEFFNTDKILLLNNRSPREALFFAELIKVRNLMGEPINFEEDGVEENTPDERSDFAELSLKEQLEKLADTTHHGGFFVASCLVSDDYANETFNWLLDRFLSNDMASMQAAGGLICHILAESSDTHEIFLSQIRALLIECDDKLLPDLVNLLGVAGLMADETGGSKPRSSNQGELITEDKYVTLRERISDLCKDLALCNKSPVASVLISQLAILDQYYWADVETELHSGLSSEEGIERLQKIASSGEMFAESLGLACVPSRSLDLLEQENSNKPKLRQLVRTIVCGSSCGFDLLLPQFIDKIHELEKSTALWTSDTIHAGFRAAKARGEKVAFEFVWDSLNSCNHALNLNISLRWPQNKDGIIRISSIASRLLKASKELTNSEPILMLCRSLSGQLEFLYEKVYLRLTHLHDKVDPTIHVPNEDVMAEIPPEANKLKELLDEILSKSSPSE